MKIDKTQTKHGQKQTKHRQITVKSHTKHALSSIKIKESTFLVLHF